MKNNSIRNKLLVFTIINVLIFNFIFWNEKLGFNLLLYIFALSFSLSYFNQQSFRTFYVRISFFLVLCSCSSMIITNSVLSVFLCICSFLVFTGFVHQEKLKTVISSFLTSFSSFAVFPYTFFSELAYVKKKFKMMSVLFRTLKVVAIPIIVFIVFYAIYAHANPVFNDYSISFWGNFNYIFQKIMEYYPLSRFLLIFLGLFIVTGILYNNNINIFSVLDNRYFNILMRDKIQKLIYLKSFSSSFKKIQLFNFKMNSLSTEYKTGVVLIILVNMLILILNIIDIKFVWFGFDSSQVDNLAYFVHEGTWYMIFSIIFSMVILLYFFRGNINFFGENHILKYGAYLWILQNAVMGISLILRNLYYIEYYYALSYKRIGVMVFLLFVFTGLITMLFKIKNRWTAFHLVRVNSWIIFVLLILIGSVNWDIQIAKFNIQKPNKELIDYDYLFSLSGDVLPVLFEHFKTIKDKDSGDCFSILTKLQNKRLEFINKQLEYTWLSWNYSDWKTLNYLKQIN